MKKKSNIEKDNLPSANHIENLRFDYRLALLYYTILCITFLIFI